MRQERRDVYHPKKKRNWVLIPAAVVLILLGLFLLLFSSLQKYLVYGQGELYIRLPWEETTPVDGETADAYRPTENAELVVDDYDFSNVQTDAGEGITTLKALYVPASDIAAGNLQSFIDRLEINNANALVLQVKPESGQLVYPSAVSTAVGYGLSGTYDLASQVSSLKDQGVYLVAELSCAIDDLLAQRYASLALTNADGTPYQDGTGVWLDLYSTALRQYLVDLANELAAMGFDEILFSYAAHPGVEGLNYTESMTTQPNAVSAVSAFSKYMEQQLGETVKLSLRCSQDALRNGVGSNGQDMDLVYRVYDRVYCASDTGTIDSDRAAALGYMQTQNPDRFVPVAYTALTDDSWMLLTWKEQ